MQEATHFNYGRRVNARQWARALGIYEVNIIENFVFDKGTYFDGISQKIQKQNNKGINFVRAFV